MTGDVHTHPQTGPYSFTRCSLAATPFGGMWRTRVHQLHRSAPTVHHIVFAELIHIIVRPYIRECVTLHCVHVAHPNICVHDNTYLVFLQVVDSPNKGHRLWSWDIQAFEELEWLICTTEKEEKYTCICVCVASCLGALRTEWSH